MSQTLMQDSELSLKPWGQGTFHWVFLPHLLFPCSLDVSPLTLLLPPPLTHQDEQFTVEQEQTQGFPFLVGYAELGMCVYINI